MGFQAVMLEELVWTFHQQTQMCFMLQLKVTAPLPLPIVEKAGTSAPGMKHLATTTLSLYVTRPMSTPFTAWTLMRTLVQMAERLLTTYQNDSST
ncbi:MAG: Uncharacterised protein [Flavobacteriales bacterium UBA4585]|nr:MAG: Uncharacterised protein [Flavobacteriales bacterium UBA4585]